jgi:hypothetical protein
MRFKEYQSRLGNQIQQVSETPTPEKSIRVYLDTQFDYACVENTNVGVERKKEMFPEENVRALINLFDNCIDRLTFEHMVVVGDDVGCGLFSFADYKKDPQTGLYLVYREYLLPLGLGGVDIDEKGRQRLRFSADFYIGVYANPCDYDGMIRNGAANAISVSKECIKLVQDKTIPATATTLDELCLKLRKIIPNMKMINQ